jgi:hypothetical protein
VLVLVLVLVLVAAAAAALRVDVNVNVEDIDGRNAGKLNALATHRTDLDDMVLRSIKSTSSSKVGGVRQCLVKDSKCVDGNMQLFFQALHHHLDCQQIQG